VLAWAAGARQGRAADVNDYLRKASSEDITAKDFRTWAGIQLAAMALAQLAELDGEPPLKSAIVRAVEQVAKHLGNTAAVCRKCYIHPAIFEGYLDRVGVHPCRAHVRLSKAQHCRDERGRSRGDCALEKTACECYAVDKRRLGTAS